MCMWVGTCAHAHMWRPEVNVMSTFSMVFYSTYQSVCQSIGLSVYSSLFETGSLPEPRAHWFGWIGCPPSPKDPSVPLLRCWDDRRMLLNLTFYMGAWEPNSGPCAWFWSTVLTEPSLHSPLQLAFIASTLNSLPNFSMCFRGDEPCEATEEPFWIIQGHPFSASSHQSSRGTGEMFWLRALVPLVEDQGSVPSPCIGKLTIAWDSISRGSDTFFWLPWSLYSSAHIHNHTYIYK